MSHSTPLTEAAMIVRGYIDAVRRRHPDWTWPRVRDELVACGYLVPGEDGGFLVKAYLTRGVPVPCFEPDEACATALALGAPGKAEAPA